MRTTLPGIYEYAKQRHRVVACAPNAEPDLPGVGWMGFQPGTRHSQSDLRIGSIQVDPKTLPPHWVQDMPRKLRREVLWVRGAGVVLDLSPLGPSEPRLYFRVRVSAYGNEDWIEPFIGCKVGDALTTPYMREPGRPLEPVSVSGVVAGVDRNPGRDDALNPPTIVLSDAWIEPDENAGMFRHSLKMR